METANAASAPSPKPRPKLSNFVQRILSSIVLLPLLGLVVWLGGWWVVGTVLLAALLALRELNGLFRAGGFHPRGVGYVVAAGCVVVATARAFWHSDLLGPWLALAVIMSLGGELIERDHAGSLLNWVLTLAGALYVAWLLSHFVLLRNVPSGAAWIAVAVLINMASDSGAYLVGRTWGRHPMAPRVSPKKSWEGAVGGFCAALLAGALGVWLLRLPVAPLLGAGLGAIGGVAGQIGDLGESLIKRQVGVKDSGHLIPGHGGLLDRIDSWLFSVPVLYYCIMWLTH